MIDLLNRLTVFSSFRKNDTIRDLFVINDMDGFRDACFKIADLTTNYGFQNEIYKAYIALKLVMDENPFSVFQALNNENIAECKEESRGFNSAPGNKIINDEFEILFRLYNYNFNEKKDYCGDSLIGLLTSYSLGNIAKERSINKGLYNTISAFMNELNEAKDGISFGKKITQFYKQYGVGKFALNRAFRVKNIDNKTCLVPITDTSEIVFEDLIGIDIQKKRLIDNTQKFMDSKPANNCLLFGDSGTGKSSSVQALLNMYCDRGLRLIEVYKHNLRDIDFILSEIRNKCYKFILFMDDLSFEDNETDYKYLKAVIEGGIEKKPDNVLIYATSNRRHLIKESFSDRFDHAADDLHRSDTVQEKLSLASRFGLSISFSSPSKKEFDHIVKELAKKDNNIDVDEEKLISMANEWSIRNGGYSGRIARQFLTGIKSD